MSVDKFGRHESTVRVRKETHRSLRDDIGLRVTDDGHFDLKNKKIRNLGEPTESHDVVSLQYVQDNCILQSDNVNVNGSKLINVGSPVELTDAANKSYVDDKCLQYTDTDIIDAKHHRIIMLKDPLTARDAVTKRYVDATSLKRDKQGNVLFDDRRLTQVQAPRKNKDAVNLEFLYYNTISLQGDIFNANGRKITNTLDGVADADTVTVRQLYALKQYTKSELFKAVKICRSRIDKLLTVVYKLHDDATRRSVHSDDSEEVIRLIDDLDSYTETEDWRSVYKHVRTTEQTS